MWKPRILVVDDELSVRISIGQILKDDHELILIDNGQEAIEYVTNNPLDVALLDVKMPGMNGIEVLKQIKAIRPEIEAVMMTAYASLDNAKDAIKYGAMDYLIKPAGVKEIQESVKKAVIKRMQRMQYNERLTALLQVSQWMTSSLETQDVINTIIDWMEKLFQAKMVWLALYNSQTETVEFAVSRGPISEEIQNAFAHGGEAITEEVFAAKQTIAVSDIAEDARIEYKEAALKAGIKSVIGLPLIVGDNIIGVLAFCSPLFEGQEDIKETTQMNLLTIFANQAAIALENARLYSDLKHSQQKLQEAQEQLIQAERLRALGEMSSGIAHNFNNILTGVMGYASLLLNSDLNDKEMLMSGLNQIEKSVRDATNLIKKLQSYAKPHTEEFNIVVDMNKIVADAVEFTKPRWKDQPQGKGITIDMKMELGQIYPVIGIEYQLREVITNLIINSVDAMPKGGQLIVTTSSESEHTIVTLSDSGIGMSEDVRKRIFEPFFTTKATVGTGLGLFTSYNIIHHHSGEITCESAPGKGTSFIIRLPKASDEDPQAEEKSTQTKQKDFTPANILVIEDEASVREIVEVMLTKCQHQVVCVDNSEDGLRNFSEQFDLVITDLGMPKMNGYELAKRFKAQRAHIPVILITGWDARPEDENVRESGIDFILHKPFTMEQLLHTVDEALSADSCNGLSGLSQRE